MGALESKWPQLEPMPADRPQRQTTEWFGARTEFYSFSGVPVVNQIRTLGCAAARTEPQQSGSEACLKSSKKWVENGPTRYTRMPACEDCVRSSRRSLKVLPCRENNSTCLDLETVTSGSRRGPVGIRLSGEIVTPSPQAPRLAARARCRSYTRCARTTDHRSSARERCRG